MDYDREKAFANAERLFKSGKAREGMEECRRIAEDAPRDLLVLNRVGDLLTRSGRPAEAVSYFDKIVDQFSASGFYPKATAILKKIVKVDPARVESLVRLGELYLKQKLPGEARPWLLQAAEAYTKIGQIAKARGVYEKLVAAEPDDLAHALRLSEARAAEGDADRAGRELIALGGRMVAAGRADEADRMFQRALSLLPGRPDALVGLARVQAASGRVEEALRFADEAWRAAAGGDGAMDDLFVLFEQLAAESRSAELLSDPRSDALSDESIEQAVRAARARGTVDGIWSRLGPLLDRWRAGRRFDRVVQLLENVGRVDDGLRIRALESIVEVRTSEGNKVQAARAIERLIRVYGSHGMQDKVDAQLAVLMRLDPGSPAHFTGRPLSESEESSAAERRPARPGPGARRFPSRSRPPRSPEVPRGERWGAGI